MKLYLHLLLSLSLTGTVPFCLYLLLKKRIDQKVSASFQYGLMKFFLLCFLFPFALCWALLIDRIKPVDALMLNGTVHLTNTLIRTDRGYHLHPDGGFYQIVLPICLMIAGLILITICLLYLRLRFRLLCQLSPDADHQQTFSALKAQMGIKPSVPLLYCPAAVSPFTFGLLRPHVVLTAAVREADAAIAIRHELQHIRSHDFLFRNAALLAVLIHCWNPVIFLFWKEFCAIQEIACDERIVYSLSPEQTRDYGYALLETTLSVQRICAFTAPFSLNDRNVIRRRIRRLRPCPLSRRKRVAFCSFLLSLVLTGFSVPVYASSPQILYVGGWLSPEELFSIDGFQLSWEDEESVIPKDEHLFSRFDQYFILPDGILKTFSSPVTIDLQDVVSCAHSQTPCTAKFHLDGDNGSCFVFAISASLCIEHGSLKDTSLYSTTQYAACPHR